MTGQPARSTARRNAARSQRADRSPSAIRGSQAGSSVADLLERGVHTSAKLATELKVNEDALYRLLRALASQGIFEEMHPRTFRNTGVSRYLRIDEPESIRPALLYWGTEFYYRSFGEILHSIETGEPARAKLFAKSDWECMQRHPELAAIFDDAMTKSFCDAGPGDCSRIRFWAWESII